MVFHFDHEERGAHVHVRVFSAPDQAQTFANLGALAMQPADWRAFRTLLGVCGGQERPDGSVRVTVELLERGAHE